MAELKDKLVSLEVLKEYDTAMVSGTLDEVVAARTDVDGTGHNSLKARLDADFNDLAGRIENTNTAVGGIKNQFAQQTEYSAY